jgi:hypothetical protein
MEGKYLEADLEIKQMRKILGKTKASQSTQTDLEVLDRAQYEMLLNEFESLKNKYEDAKRMVKLRNENVQGLQKLLTEAQNSKANHSNNQLKKTVDVQTDTAESDKEMAQLKADLKLVSKKYDQAKQLYNFRLNEVTELKKRYEDLKQKYDGVANELDNVSQKYLTIKNLCIIRNNALRTYRQRYGLLETDKVPENGENGDQENKKENGVDS